MNAEPAEIQKEDNDEDIDIEEVQEVEPPKAVNIESEAVHQDIDMDEVQEHKEDEVAAMAIQPEAQKEEMDVDEDDDDEVLPLVGTPARYSVAVHPELVSLCEFGRTIRS